MKMLGWMKWPAVLACGTLLGGCVAVNTGPLRVFTKEYPTGVAALGAEEAVSHEPHESVSGRDEDGRRILRIGLLGEVVSQQSVEQSWERVTVEKQRRLAFGFMPYRAELLYRPQGSLMPLVGWNHKGGGNYETWVSSDARGEVLAGLLWLPYSLLVAPFLPYECRTHHWGRQSRPSLQPYGDSKSKNEVPMVNYLTKFSDRERQEIGAWMWSDEKTHPQRRAASTCSHLGAFGFHKYCTYVVKGPERFSMRTREEPERKTRKRSVLGPYRVTLELPECGFVRTLDVPEGESAVDFDLGGLDAADGHAEGTVSFQPPAEGLDAVRSPDDRALLEAASRRPFPVRVQVRPAGLAGAVATTVSENRQPQEDREIHNYNETSVLENRDRKTAPQ